ncbi:hypothetical protein ACWD4V_13810 [Streptomyces tsukubensis]
MALLTADEIDSADDRTFEDVPVPEWGGTVRIMSMSGTDRNSYQQSMVVMGPDGKPKEVRLEQQLARLLARCLVDESGRRLYVTDKQIQSLGRRDGAVLERLAAIAKRVSKLGKDSVEEAEGNSAAAESGSSTSD